MQTSHSVVAKQNGQTRMWISLSAEKGETKMTTLVLIVRLLPAIIETIKRLEETMPQSGLGGRKLDLIIQGIVIAYQEFGGFLKDVPALDKVTSFVTKYVGYAVGVFNDVGVFKKGNGAPALAPGA